MFGSDASFPKSQQSGKTQVSVTARKKKKGIAFARQVVFYPEGNSTRNASNLQT